MMERLPVSGIKQSYRHTRETRTVVMPVFIALVMGGLAAFYFYGKPETALDAAPVQLVAEPIPVEELPSTEEASAETGSEAIVEPPAPADPTASFKGYTPWMSPLALDTYIRHRNGEQEKSFWERGHWISSVEGRWKDGAHEFRIAISETPKIPQWRWQYRIDQTPDEFLASNQEMRSNGFRLLHVQSYDHPDQRRRYQAVWESTEANTAPVATTAPNESGSPQAHSDGPIRFSGEQLHDLPVSGNVPFEQPTPTETVVAESSPAAVVRPSSGALDVNRLDFR